MESERKLRVEAKARRAIEALASRDLAAAASVLRVGRIEVVEKGVETAALQLERGFSENRFKIVLGAEFCDRPQRDVEALLLHELLHHVMRHLEEEEIGSNGLLCNVVQDAFINRTIDAASPELSAFMAEYYDPSEMPCALLRPGSEPETDQELYEALYAGQITEVDLYKSLEGQIEDEQLAQVKLLGSHERGEAPALTDGQAKQVLEELKEQLERCGKGDQASPVRDQLQLLQQAAKAKRREEVERAFKRALCASLGSASSEEGSQEGERRSPLMPQHPHRADLYWTLSGIDPFLWRSPDRKGEGGCAVYLDVSGSMYRSIELVYSSCLALEDLLAAEIYLFSNQVAQIDLRQLKEGAVETTMGTEFSCVAEHMLERADIEKAIIFTDGYATMPQELSDRLEAERRELIGVVTPDGSDAQMGFCREIFRMPETP